MTATMWINYSTTTHALGLVSLSLSYPPLMPWAAVLRCSAALCKSFAWALGPPIEMKIEPSRVYDQAGVDGKDRGNSG
jgi:hypothetical protein